MGCHGGLGVIECLGEAGQISRTGGTPLDDPHGRSAVFPGEEFLVGEGTGLSSHQHFPGTVAGFSELWFLRSKLPMSKRFV